MDYLEEYISKEDIEEILDSLEDMDVNHLCMHSLNVSNIIEYLLSIGVKDIKNVILNKISIFYEECSKVKSIIEESDFVETIRLFNEDIVNLDLFN